MASFFPFTDKRKSDSTVKELAADLQTQLESLLSEVWKCERNWTFDDKLDCALRIRKEVKN